MDTKKRILVVDDEEDLCEIMKFNLEQAGYEVEVAYSAEDALVLDIAEYDLLILDIMMGEISGHALATILKKRKNTQNIPIIFCSAKTTENDTVKGLELGADDYITKPYSMREVIARVQAVLRRFEKSNQSLPPTSHNVQYQDLILNLDLKNITIKGETHDLTKKEFELLKLLIQNLDTIYSRSELLDRVWPNDVFVNDRTVDVHIARLRKKIAPYSQNIVSRSGYGYCFKR